MIRSKQGTEHLWPLVGQYCGKSNIYGDYVMFLGFDRNSLTLRYNLHYTLAYQDLYTDNRVVGLWYLATQLRLRRKS
jgi:hypothetical protein